MSEPEETIINKKARKLREKSLIEKESEKTPEVPEPAEAPPEKPKKVPEKTAAAKKSPKPVAKKKAPEAATEKKAPETVAEKKAPAEKRKPPIEVKKLPIEAKKAVPAPAKPAKPESNTNADPAGKVEALEKRVASLSKGLFLQLLLSIGLGVFVWVTYDKISKSAGEEPKKAAAEEPAPFVPVVDESVKVETEAVAKMLEEVKGELEIQKTRNKLTAWADQAISFGSRYAYSELRRFLKESQNSVLKDACNAERTRVETHYVLNARIRKYSIPMEKLFPGKKSDTELTAEELVNLLLAPGDHWEIRARAAQLLGDIRGDIAVPRALIRALQTDSDLYVVQAALRSFEKVTGYRAAGIFDSSVAVAWWKGNEERFAKRN